MKRAVLAAFVLLSLSAFMRGGPTGSSAHEAAQRGRETARADIKAGHLALRTYGFAYAGSPAYARLLKERLGVEVKSAAGCVIDAAILAETNAYNEVMKSEIARRFGKNALETIEAEAQKAVRAAAQ